MGEIHVHRDNYRNFKDEKSNFIMNLFAKLWSRQLLNNLKKLDRFVVLTETDRKAWKELDNVVTIANPSPFMPTAVSPLTEKRVIAVARYSHEKGIDLLLEAWAQVEKRTSGWRLEVFGDGDTTAFNALIDRLGIDRNRCILNGRTSQIEQEYLEHGCRYIRCRLEGEIPVQCEIPQDRQDQRQQIAGPPAHLDDIVEDRKRSDLDDSGRQGKQSELDGLDELVILFH